MYVCMYACIYVSNGFLSHCRWVQAVPPAVPWNGCDFHLRLPLLPHRLSQQPAGRSSWKHLIHTYTNRYIHTYIHTLTSIYKSMTHSLSQAADSEIAPVKSSPYPAAPCHTYIHTYTQDIATHWLPYIRIPFGQVSCCESGGPTSELRLLLQHGHGHLRRLPSENGDGLSLKMPLHIHTYICTYAHT